MKKLLLILMLVASGLIGYGQKIADLTRATTATKTDLLIIDQSDATKGIAIQHLFAGDSLFLPDLATSDVTVLSPTSTGGTKALATEDINNIVITESGGMAYVSTSGTQTIGTGGTFERINEGAIAYTGSHLHDFTHSDGRLTYTGTNTKHFTVQVSYNIEGDETAQLVQIQLYKDGALISATNDQHDYTAVDTDDTVGFVWLLEIATGEYVEVHGTSDTNGDTFYLHNGSMVISQH